MSCKGQVGIQQARWKAEIPLNTNIGYDTNFHLNSDPLTSTPSQIPKQKKPLKFTA